MAQFDEEKQNKKLEDFKKQEEEDVVKMLAAEKYGLPYINLAGVIIENEALRTVEEDEARKIGVAPFKILGKKIHIAVHSPGRPEVTALKENIIRGGLEPILYMVSQASLDKVWERYRELSYATGAKIGGMDISGEVILSIAEKIKIIKDVEAVIVGSEQEKGTHQLSHMLEIIMAGASALGASDIHIEPEQDRVRLRYRLDGVLQNIMFFNFGKYKLLNSRIKLMSGLKLTQTQQAQDGRFSIFISGEEVNIRTSTVPGAYGEGIVMRLLDPRTIKAKLEDLGIEPRLFSILEKEIEKPHGLILITGPTGSGKTTTLYAFLKRIYSPELKIITIEDPIEYHMQGITQTQVEHEKGYDFLAGLRAALRQDPDIIMLGEIRDAETGKTAVESALTGHMVFSTLHTNNAQGVIPRLIDLGVNAKILVSALSISMAQRLARKLCDICKIERAVTKEEEEQIKKILQRAQEDGKDLSSYGVNLTENMKVFIPPTPNDCEKCHGLGYKGRIGIFEAILTDEEIEKIIPNNPSEREIKKIARKQGILDMKEDGIIKALRGITSLEEIKAVVDFDEE